MYCFKIFYLISLGKNDTCQCKVLLVGFLTTKIFLFVKFTIHYKQIKLDKIELILVNIIQTLKGPTKPDNITQWNTSLLELKSGFRLKPFKYN